MFVVSVVIYCSLSPTLGDEWGMAAMYSDDCELRRLLSYYCPTSKQNCATYLVSGSDVRDIPGAKRSPSIGGAGLRAMGEMVGA